MGARGGLSWQRQTDEGVEVSPRLSISKSCLPLLSHPRVLGGVSRGELPTQVTSGAWLDEIVASHGVGGLVVWGFDTHREIERYHR
jgi:hypothetical protein